MMSFKSALGYTIRDLRLQQSLTMRELASRSHIAYNYLSEVERGTKDASSQVLGLIAQGLGFTTSHLVRQTADVLADWEQQETEMSSWDSVLTRM